MFAVIKTGGKQYKVSEGDTLTIERLEGAAGNTITFDTVLMVGEGASVTVGAPLVAGATVTAELAQQTLGPKLITRKKRQRQTYRRTIGHRQDLTEVTITSINTDGKAPKKAAAKKEEPKAEKPAAEPKAAAPKAAAPKAAAKADGDDLTKIKGIGKVFATKLNAEGITTYAQIAALTAAEIEALEDKLGASGRFENDEWVAQAKDLA